MKLFRKEAVPVTIDRNTLHKNLKLLRTMHSISQEDLSSAIHLARSTYSAYETGAKTPDLQTLDALAALYDISFDSLVNYDLSEGLLNRIYFANDNKEAIDLLNSYQGLSVSSKFLIAQRLDVLLEKEDSLYRSSLTSKDIKKK